MRGLTRIDGARTARVEGGKKDWGKTIDEEGEIASTGGSVFLHLQNSDGVAISLLTRVACDFVSLLHGTQLGIEPDMRYIPHRYSMLWL